MVDEQQADKQDVSKIDDDIEPLIIGLLENKDALTSLLNLLTRMRKSGLIEILDDLSSDYLPSDLEFLTTFLTSRDALVGVVKMVNVLAALSHSLSSERAGDTLKAIAFNSDLIFDNMVSGAKNPESIGLMGLYALLKDPDISAGLSAMMGALKALGIALKKVPEK
ncbi:MAG: DUF1641 domain-containing protein [Thermoplasmatales archaeon]|nr:DUF1641 domain-containing protein [Thermoplasmatales archaeon]MCW6171017.1 DUF1641 domain-containing protein [Thermoplasmatales archaeon]